MPCSRCQHCHRRTVAIWLWIQWGCILSSVGTAYDGSAHYNFPVSQECWPAKTHSLHWRVSSGQDLRITDLSQATCNYQFNRIEDSALDAQVAMLRDVPGCHQHCCGAFSPRSAELGAILRDRNGSRSEGFLKVGLSLLQVWVYAIIVTEAGAYDNASADTQKYCRTDQSSVLSNSPWFRRVFHVICKFMLTKAGIRAFHVSSFLVVLTSFGLICRWPYFAQWGAPTFSWSSTLTMLAGAISAMVESV